MMRISISIVCACVLLGSAGCADRLVETSLTIRRKNTKPCLATVDGSRRKMNTYWIEL